MASISVTMNTVASGPFNIGQLFAGDTYGGAVTIAPVVPLRPQSKPLFMSVQSDIANGAKQVYVGDRNISPANVGAWGKALAAGFSADVQNVEQSITQRYVSGSADGTIVNIEVLGGFQ